MSATVTNVSPVNVAVPDDPTGGAWEPGEAREVRDEHAVLFAGHAHFEVVPGPKPEKPVKATKRKS